MTHDKMDCLSAAKSGTTITEDEIGPKELFFMAVVAGIALATVVLLPVVAQVIAFAAILKWFKTNKDLLLKALKG